MEVSPGQLWLSTKPNGHCVLVTKVLLDEAIAVEYPEYPSCRWVWYEEYRTNISMGSMDHVSKEDSGYEDFIWNYNFHSYPSHHIRK